MTTKLSTEIPETILEALGIPELAPSEQEEMLLELNDLIFKGTLVRMVEKMDEATKDSFNALMDTDPSEEEVEVFLAKNVPEADLAVQETLDELASDILAVTESNA